MYIRGSPSPFESIWANQKGVTLPTDPFRSKISRFPWNHDRIQNPLFFFGQICPDPEVDTSGRYQQYYTLMLLVFIDFTRALLNRKHIRNSLRKKEIFEQSRAMSGIITINHAWPQNVSILVLSESNNFGFCESILVSYFTSLCTWSVLFLIFRFRLRFLPLT